MDLHRQPFPSRQDEWPNLHALTLPAPTTGPFRMRHAPAEPLEFPDPSRERHILVKLLLALLLLAAFELELCNAADQAATSAAMVEAR